MSKRSRRRNAADRDKLRPTAEKDNNSSAEWHDSGDQSNTADTTTSRPFRRFIRRRVPLLVALACLVAAGSYLINNIQKSPRPGIIEYSSDDPDAQVILEKDGQEIPLEREAKFTKHVEPGEYKLRLANPTDGLKLQPHYINMDAGGRAFVTVRRVPKVPSH